MAPAAVCGWVLELSAMETSGKVEWLEDVSGGTSDLAPAAVWVFSEVSEEGVEAWLEAG